MKIRVTGLGCIIIIFLFIYYPPIAITNTMHFVAIWSYYYLFLGGGRSEFRYLKYRAQKLMLSLALIVIYLLFVALFNDVSVFAATYDIVVMCLEVIPSAFAISILCLKKSHLDLSQWLIVVGMIQAIISILAFINPAFKQIIIDNMLRYGFSDIINKMARIRMYGWSYTMAFAMPIVQAAIAVLAIYLGMTRNSKYLLTVPFLAFSSVINARVGIVVMVLGLIVIIFGRKKASVKNNIIVLLCFVLFTGLSLNVSSRLQSVSPGTYKWITEGLGDMMALFNGNSYSEYSYFKYIADADIYRVPDGIKLLFGTGSITTRNNSLIQSDIGFINDIWLGGLIYVFAFYGLIISQIHKICSYYRYKYNSCGVLLEFGIIGLIMVANIKGRILSFNEASNLIILSVVYLISKIELEAVFME